MATARESSSAYGSGVGGKFRKRPFRRAPATPYDRPPTAVRNPGWVSKLLVEPASKLISAGAHRLFASVFRKRLLPPPSPPSPPPREENKETIHAEEVQLGTGAELQGEVQNDHAGSQEAVGGHFSPAIISDNCISELEKLLQQKTFTRSEIERLTELLHSRAVDLPNGDDDKRIEANLSKSLPDFDKCQDQSGGTLKEDKVKSYGVSTPTSSAKVLVDDLASPAELAKAYMGSRPSKVSPTMLGLRSQLVREDPSLLNNVSYAPRSPIMTLAKKSGAHVGGSEYGYITPRSRGRSAIYNMARTPYTRVHQSATQKGMLTNPSPYRHDEQFRSKQEALKRRSSVLDDDIGALGPIRRIRQKPNLLSHGFSLQTNGTGAGPNATEQPASIAYNIPLTNQNKNNSNKAIGEIESRSTPSTSYARVPSKSSETATRILQHLENLTPKEKPSEARKAAEKGKSPSKLTLNMLHGQALRSMEDLDSPKLLLDADNGRKLKDLSNAKLSFPGESSSKLAEDVSPKPLASLRDFTAETNNQIRISVRDSGPGVENSGYVSKPFEQPPQKKQAFKMSAHEDFLEVEDDLLRANGPAPVIMTENAKLNMFTSGSIPVTTNQPLLDKTEAAPTKRTAPEPASRKKTDSEICDANVIGDKCNGIFTTFHASSHSSPAELFAQSSPAFDKSNGANDQSAYSVTDLASKKRVWTGPKLESSSCLPNAVSTMTDAGRRSSELNQVGAGNSILDGVVNGRSETAPSFSVSTNEKLSSCPTFLVANSSGSLSSTSMASNSLAGMFTGTSAASSSNFVSAISHSFVAPPVAKESAVAPAVSNVQASDSNAKEIIFGNSSSSSSGSIFGLSMSSSSSAGQSQKPPVGTNDGAQVGQTSFAGLQTASFPKNTPNQLGSAAAQVMGTSGDTSFGSGPATKPSGSSTSFLSTASSSGLNLADSKFGSNSKTFSFGLSSSVPSTEVNVVSSSSSITPSTVTFGVAATSGSSAVNSSTGANSSISGLANNALASSSGAELSYSSASTASTNASFASSSAFLSGSTTVGSSSSFPNITFGTPVSSSGTNTVGSSSSATSGTFIFGAAPPASPQTNRALSSNTSVSPIFSFSSSMVSNPVSSSSNASPAFNFSSNWQAPKSPVFGSTFSSTSPFTFEASSSFASTHTSTTSFSSTLGASSGSAFAFASSSATSSSAPSLPPTPAVFGNFATPFASATGNNDQMSMEDSMAEDPVQTAAPAIPVFGQAPVSPSSQGFMFGSPAVPPPGSFQFGAQPGQASMQNPSPFQPSSSLNAGGSFSLGSGGGDKSGRKFVKVNRNRHKKR